MKSGLIIKTTAELKEDKFFYSWLEDGVPAQVEKRNVRTIKYFSMKVSGTPPKTQKVTAAQRRLTGKPIHYERDGQLYLKCRHIDDKGRSQEGGGALNYVREIQVGSVADGYRQLKLVLRSETPGSIINLKFYNRRGKLVARADADIKTSKKKNQTSDPMITLDASLDMKALGLIEVSSEKAGDE